MSGWHARIAASTVGIVVAAALGGCGDQRVIERTGGGAAAAGLEDPLVLEIQSVTLPPGVGARPVVRFRLVDPTTGAPLDVAAEMANFAATPRAFPNVRPRFTLAQLDDDGNYASYYTTTETASTTFTPPPGPPPTPTPTPATQATSQTGTVAGLATVGNGVYDITLGPTNLDLDRTRTHTLAAWFERARSSSDTDVAHGSLNFVPNGGTPVLDQTVTDNNCNRCHGILQAHGTRRGTQLCITCHSPQTTDAETSRTVDFKVMIHKIHFGASLPSVQQAAEGIGGQNYYIVGFNESVHDYSEVAFPFHDGVQHCTACHSGEDQDNWQTRASFAACTSCHDNVRFAGALTPCNTAGRTPQFADCLHSGGPLADVQTTNATSCRICHGGASSLVPVSGAAHHGD